MTIKKFKNKKKPDRPRKVKSINRREKTRKDQLKKALENE